MKFDIDKWLERLGVITCVCTFIATFVVIGVVQDIRTSVEQSNKMLMARSAKAEAEMLQNLSEVGMEHILEVEGEWVPVFSWAEGEAFDYRSFRRFIKMTLKEADAAVPGGPRLYSEEMVNILLGTCATESDFGLTSSNAFQMLESNVRDMERNYFPYTPEVGKKVDIFWWDDVPLKEQLHANMQLQIVLAATHYIRTVDSLPSSDDVWAMAWTWKKVYNTRLGAGQTGHFYKKFKKYCEA